MSKQLNIPTDIAGVEKVAPVAVWSMEPSYLASNQPAINGPAKIVYDQTIYEDGRLHERTVENPTYRDLFRIANELIVESGDDHHVFIEDFYYDEENDYWVLCTGS